MNSIFNSDGPLKSSSSEEIYWEVKANPSLFKVINTSSFSSKVIALTYLPLLTITSLFSSVVMFLNCIFTLSTNSPLSSLISQGTVPNADYSAVPNILDRTDLDIYYQKISKAFATIPDTSGDPSADQIQARVEENRIVGPISDEYRVLQITRNGQTATAVTVDEFDNPRDHGFSVGVNINISGVTGSTGPQSELDSGIYNGSFTVTSASGNVFTYQMAAEPSGNAVGSNVTVKTEIDTVDSASPYAFNLSLRSVWGMNGLIADTLREERSPPQFGPSTT